MTGSFQPNLHIDHTLPPLRTRHLPTKSKAHLMEACELVEPGGPSPSPSEEQDVVLELGNLWYNRYLICDEQVKGFVFNHVDSFTLGF